MYVVIIITCVQNISTSYGESTVFNFKIHISQLGYIFPGKIFLATLVGTLCRAVFSKVKNEQIN